MNINKSTIWHGAAFLILAAGLTALCVTGCSSNNSEQLAARFGVASARAAEPIGHIGTGKCAEAVEKACNADKYVFALFYKENNDQLTRARDLVESARKKVARKADAVEINVADSSERDIVNKFGAARASLPLVLVLAPNGAIMGGYPVSILADDSRLVESVGCKAAEQTMKALQQKNMVLLCIQNSSTPDKDGAMRGVEDFAKDEKFGPTTAVVTADPADPEVTKFINQLGVETTSLTATTLLLAPPGSVVGTFQGPVGKDKIMAAVQAAAAPKAGGCCPPGSGKSCGPTGSAAPQQAPQTAQPQTTTMKKQGK